MTEWRPIPDRDGYEASDDGRVRSWKRPGPPRELSQHDVDGYARVNLSVAGRNVSSPVHRLVCAAFHGAPSEGQEARHLDGQPHRNAPSNLAWGTHAENMQDRLRHGRNPQSIKDRCPQKHPYDEANTLHRRGWRECRACRAEKDADPDRGRTARRRRAARS